MADNVLINQGTSTSIATDDVGGVHYQTVKLDVGVSGVSSPFTGTIGAVTNLAGGTVTRLESGTLALVTRAGNIGTVESGSVIVTNLNSGTVNALAAGTITGGTLGNLNYGTISIDAKPAGSAILTTHTLGTGGGTFVGTMVAPVGAGTYIYLTGISIIARSGGSIDAGIASNIVGSTGAGVVARGFIPTAGGGIARDFNPAIRIGTNGTLAYFLITAGTADFNATYWVGP